MYVKHTLVILLATTLFFTCHKRSINKSLATTTEKSEKQADIPVKNVIVDAETDMADKGALYTIDSIKINEDILSVYVNYSGGCESHSFELYSNDMYAKSMPPQLSLCLRHTNNNDNCRELISKELKFNVANLKYAGKSTVVLKLADKKITYLVK
jgi:hypothetical protein